MEDKYYVEYMEHVMLKLFSDLRAKQFESGGNSCNIKVPILLNESETQCILSALSAKKNMMDETEEEKENA